MIKTENLSFRYRQKSDLLNFPDIRLNTEDELLIIGQSGRGKTTLLHLLAGLLKPSKGNIRIGDVSIGTLTASKLDSFRGQNIGLVFQRNHAIQSLSVLKNLEARLYFSNKSIDRVAIDELLEELGLLEFKNRPIQTLSEGQLQRLGIAMAVIHNPKVIMADEPTSSLDDDNCKIVIDLLKKQAKKNKANLIVITHDQRIKPFFQNTISL